MRDLSTRSLVFGYAVLYLVLGVVLQLGQASPLREGQPLLGLDFAFRGPGWVDGFYRWDSDWYMSIVTQGYYFNPGLQSSVAFFPGYPLVVRAVAALVGNPELAGHLVSVGAGVAAVVLFRGWARRRLPTRAPTFATIALMLYPFGVFLYGMVYGDALFLAATVAAFVLLERDLPVAAGLVGAVATASRPVGVAVTVGLMIRVLERVAERRDPAASRVRVGALVRACRHLRPRDLAPALSLAGLLGWMTYLWVTFANPLAFVDVEAAPGWNQGAGPRTWLKLQYVEAIARHSSSALVFTANAIAAIVVLLLIPRVRRTLGWGYAAYTTVVIGIPLLGTGTFMGCGRYGLAAFPAFAALGSMLAERSHTARRAVFIAFGICLVVATYAVGMGVLAT